MISDHGHETPRVREISAPTSTRETDNDNRHWSEIVGDKFLKRVGCSNVVRCSFAASFCLVSHRRWFAFICFHSLIVGRLDVIVIVRLRVKYT